MLQLESSGISRVAAMVARADAVVERVHSGDYAARLKAVREMKNQVVGSRAKKLQYLKAGAVPHLVAILAAEGNDPGLLVQVRFLVRGYTCQVPAVLPTR